MSSQELIESCKQRVNLALIHHLGAEGESLGTRVDAIAPELPPELLVSLRELCGFRAQPDADAQGEACIDFAFRCGQAVERIANLARTRAADDLIYTGTDGRPLADPSATDLDTLSRFRVARDRFLRKAADFSLKVLVGLIVLFSLAMLLGLI